MLTFVKDPILEINHEFDYQKIIKNIKNVQTSDIKVDTSKLKNDKIGSYPVTYIYQGKKFTVNINVVDKTKPKFEINNIEIDPFNDIDGLILSELVYVDFDKIVPTFPNEQSYCLKDVANNFSQVNNIEELLDEISFTKESITLLQELAKCPRYQNILLSNYINELDYQSIKQFAAITFQLEDSSIYVAFRGTDDTILAKYSTALC